MIKNNLSWINLNASSSGGSGGGGVSDYNDLANRPIISMTGTSQNPLKLWNLSTGLYLLNGYVYYNTTNTRECVNLFVSITAQIQNGKYVLSAFVPSWEGHYEYIKVNSTSTDYIDTQILKMLTEDDVLTLTNEVEYTPTTDYHPSTKKYVDEAMQSVMEEFAKMGVNEQDIKTLIAENRRRDIAIQALLNETADKNVTIEEDTHTISLDYSMEDGMATVNSIEGSTLVNVSKTVDEVYVTKSQDRVEQTKVANTIGEQNGKICPIIEGDTLVNVCDQKEPIAITKSYAVENSGNHIPLQGEYDGKCRPVIQGNTMVNLHPSYSPWLATNTGSSNFSVTTKQNYIKVTGEDNSLEWRFIYCGTPRLEMLKPSTTYTIVCTKLKGVKGFHFCATTNLHYIGAVDIDVNNNPLVCTFTTEDTIEINGQVVYVLIPDSGDVDVEIENLMIFEGDLTQTPELIPTEYVEGLKSSFEDNLVTQTMVDSGEESAENLGKYKVEYKVTGKNKFDGVWEFGDITWDKGTYSDSTSSIRSINFMEVKEGQNLSFNYNSRENLAIRLYDENKKYLGATDLLSTTSKIYSGDTRQIPKGVCYMKIKINSTDINFQLQIEEGTTPTEYEPYKEYTKTFYLNSPLLEGDTIEDINGVATHVKRYGKAVLDGSEKWSTGGSGTSSMARFCLSKTTLNNYASETGITTVICDKFASGNGYGITSPRVWISSITGSSTGDLNITKEIGDTITSYNDTVSFKQWLQANPTTIIYQLASPVYEPISTESILCDSYVNGHLDFDSAVPIEKVVFNYITQFLRYLKPSTKYKIQFESDNEGVLYDLGIGSYYIYIQDVTKGVNIFNITTLDTLPHTVIRFNGIGFNASNIVVTEVTDKEFDYFNGIQSTFEENLVTDENNPHYGKYRVIYRTKSSDGNASTVKSVYLNSPLLKGDKLVVVNGKLCHYHKMGMAVLDGSEDWSYNSGQESDNTFRYCLKTDIGCTTVRGNIMCDKLSVNRKIFELADDKEGICNYSNGLIFIRILKSKLPTTDIQSFKQWLQANPTTVVYELASPYYEEISSNPKDTVVDFYANGTLEVQSAVYPLSMEFTSFEEELTYLYASTVYTVQFEANGNAIANITLGGATVTNQEITHGVNKIQVTTPSTLVDNKLIIDGCRDCKISKIVVTNSTEEFEYFEGMKSAFEDKQNEDGTYTVEIVVYNAPIRLNKDKE